MDRWVDAKLMETEAGDEQAQIIFSRNIVTWAARVNSVADRSTVERYVCIIAVET